jgi:transcriptional regulator with XRE-family HTH domain
MNWLNLGKKRTRFGSFLDKNGIEQQEIEKKSKINKNTLSKMCNDEDYIPRKSTAKRTLNALKNIGYEQDEDDFWS